MKQYREIIVSQIDKIKTYSSLLATFNIDTSSVTVSILCRGSNFYKCFYIFVFVQNCLFFIEPAWGGLVFVWAQTCMMFLSGLKLVWCFCLGSNLFMYLLWGANTNASIVYL